MIANGGTPIVVQAKRHNDGLKVTQGDSYLLVRTDELEPLIAAMRDVMPGSPDQ
jgi:hypothetical protein